MSNTDTPSIDEVYRQLVDGAGRELVNDDNVEALAKRADQDGHPILATELREWASPC